MRAVVMRHLLLSSVLMAAGCRGSAASSPSERKPREVLVTQPDMTEGQRFVRERYEELIKFKASPDFHRIGFGRGGPYHRWLESLEARRSDRSYSVAERAAIGDLQTLGLEYVKTRGVENDYTRFANAQVRRAIAGAQ